MVQDDTYTINENFENIYGNKIKLRLSKYRNNILKITIKYSDDHRIFIRWEIMSCLMVFATFEYFFSLRLSGLIHICILLIIFLQVYRFLHCTYQENLIIVKSLGYQIETKSIMKSKSEFIPWDAINDVFINEVLKNQTVLLFLTIFIRNLQKKQVLLPLFTATKPRLKCLEIVYKELKEL